MKVSIVNSVGRFRGNNSVNRPDDTLAIQRLLKTVSEKLDDERYDPGAINGAIIPAPHFSQTVSAIIAFQKRYMRHPDGQVDPGRRTLRNLNEVASYPRAKLHSVSDVNAIGGSLSISKAFSGKGMSEICPSGQAKLSSNHCAHFVGHALDITVGLTCHGMTSRKYRRGERASLRVQEIFAACPAVEEFDAQKTYGRGLMFVSATKNFVANGSGMKLKNVSKKHIGIHVNGTIWHYSNSRNKVISQTPAEFIKHYRGQKNALWFGTLPPGSISSFSA